MTEKVGLIKNPLTIIAIFAGIAEVSGTLVLPFIHENNQELFIYFLISFPTALVVLFFLTLNFNNKVLYAPSDYQDETNYIKINKYDFSRQQNVEVKVSRDDAKNIQFLQLTEKVNFINTQLIKLENSILAPEENEKFLRETIGRDFKVTNFENVNQFIKYMGKIGVAFEIYHSPEFEEDFDNDFSDNESIWLGGNVSLNLAKIIIKNSKSFYPHLKYIGLSKSMTDIYIGGSTESAVKTFKLRPLKDQDFEKLNTFKNLDSFHNFIKSFKK
ncbi:hypothetical protein [Flavobacterium sp. YO12]|uniref:hypothetical protein n=1 Tax=Flavobacterium sp. YO12 TaxID=1920029 RepID=UPI0019D6E8F3|nr:hypothetical protein [Flavobacterium sp. YO12]